VTSSQTGHWSQAQVSEVVRFQYNSIIGCCQVSLDETDVSSDRNSYSEQWYQIVVKSGNTGRDWTIRRSYESLYTMDRQLHRCIFDRKTSLLPEMTRDLVDEIGANVSDPFGRRIWMYSVTFFVQKPFSCVSSETKFSKLI
jgi:hypothetical protein